MLLEVISNFHKARFIRRLYKTGLLNVLRPWLTVSSDPSAEAVIEMTLNFLLHMWTTKAMISNYSFNIGRAIVKVKKNGNAVCSELAGKVKDHWTEILSAEEPKAEPEKLGPPSGLSSGQIALPPANQFNTIALPQSDYVSSLPLGFHRVCCSL